MSVSGEKPSAAPARIRHCATASGQNSLLKTSVIDGIIYDTHNAHRNGKRCVYGYWSMQTTDGDQKRYRLTRFTDDWVIICRSSFREA